MLMLRRKIILKIVIVTLVAAAILFTNGLREFYSKIPDAPTSSAEKADAIIVLTGGKERIAEGINLLNHKYAPKLLISGVGKETKVEAVVRQQKLSVKELKGIDYSKIYVGHEAINTIGNARETAEWVKQNNVKSIILTTANYHMPRALVEFRKHMPELVIIPHPVFPEDFKKQNWENDSITRSYIFKEYVKYLTARIGK